MSMIEPPKPEQTISDLRARLAKAEKERDEAKRLASFWQQEQDRTQREAYIHIDSLRAQLAQRGTASEQAHSAYVEGFKEARMGENLTSAEEAWERSDTCAGLGSYALDLTVLQKRVEELTRERDGLQKEMKSWDGQYILLHDNLRAALKMTMHEAAVHSAGEMVELTVRAYDTALAQLAEARGLLRDTHDRLEEMGNMPMYDQDDAHRLRDKALKDAGAIRAFLATVPPAQEP